MAYEDLVERLADEPEERTVTALPDGSVDVYHALYDANGERIEDRETFAERLTEGKPSFPVERESTEPGGQAVNMARQADALGNRVRLYGHLDDPVFDELDVERVSMGAPSRIEIHSLDEDVLFTEVSPDIADWTLERFQAVADDPAERLAAAAICWGNWASAPGLTEAFRELADASIDGGLFLLDPGPITTRSDGSIQELLEALSALESAYNVVLSLDPSELEAITRAIGVDEADDRERLAELRAEAGLTALVLHAESEATAAIRGRNVSVENLTVEEPVRETGAGDRFDAGLVHALGRDWGLETALALGNACASYAVETAGTADREALRSWLE
ncbi:PfkB family carbohydrate kinase [Halalkalicoccus ordinarius]|uniref:PfkB family carbohydrate kinase n=1 Tax=Halalkalicoccus ordinarius TaxID=3116651 RepID=UPI00300F1E0A